MKKLLSCILVLALLAPIAAGADFAASSRIFDPDLAQKALQIAESCYMPDVQQISLRMEGFRRVGLYHEKREKGDTRHTVMYSVYERSGADGAVDVIIAIRGTGAGEWELNMDLMPSGNYDLPYAENFMLAARDILDTQSIYLTGLSSPAILVTGYSRGAAVANMLGAMLTDIFGEERVYVYTFACPRTVRGEVPVYHNIFNVINPADIITHLPLLQWGVGRYGADIELPVRDTSLSEAARAGYDMRKDRTGDYRSPLEHLEDVQELAARMGDAAPDAAAAYTVRRAFSHPGAAADGEEGITMAEFLRNIFERSETFSALMTRMSRQENDFTEILRAYYSASGKDGSWITGMHMPDMYGAWLSVMEGQ
ncbi:MAG: hypothetical protein J5564_01920 [Clostridia bacterium]|nr:hypothetical protein [Clostridia bacterium]